MQENSLCRQKIAEADCGLERTDARELLWRKHGDGTAGHKLAAKRPEATPGDLRA